MTRRFFVIGPQKTGTTLLARLLDQQPRVACMFESYIWSERRSVLAEQSGNGRLHGIHADDQARWRARFAPAFWPEAAHPADVHDAEQVDVLRDVMSEVLDDFGRRLGADVVGDKWPFYTDRLPLLLDAFPDASYVHTVRDPRGQWNSAEQFRGRGRGWQLLDDLLQRDEVVREAFAGQEARVEIVRYEELLEDPAAVIGRLAAAIGFAPQLPLPDYDPAADPLPRRWNWVPESTRVVDGWHGVKWRASVPRPTVEEIERAAAPYMERHGYEPATWPSIVIGILTLPGEEAETRSLVQGIESLGDTGVAVHVLVNGGDSSELADLAALDRVTVRAVSRNIGVAAGRNCLLEDAALRDADIVGFLDNDLIVFSDLFDAVRAAFATYDDARVLGAALFDHATFVAAMPAVIEDGRSIDRAAIRAVADWPVVLARCARNLGSNIDLDYAYDSAEAPLYSALLRHGVAIPADRHIYNSGRPDLAERFAAGETLTCGNVPGGVSFFRGGDVRSGAVRYDERFGPYGAEDVELSWRLADAGSRNRVTLASGAVHGMTSRQDERRPVGRVFVEMVNVSRVRSILVRDRHPDGWRPRLLGQAVASLLAEAIHRRGEPARRLLAWMLGTMLVDREAPRDGLFSWPVELGIDILDRDPVRFRRTTVAPESVGAVLEAFERCRTMPNTVDDRADARVAELADEARRLGRRLDDEFDVALAHLAGMALAGEAGEPAMTAAREREGVTRANARESARRVNELEGELHRRERLLNRRAVRFTLRVTNALGKSKRRLRRS